jgi:hypothetical protein
VDTSAVPLALRFNRAAINRISKSLDCSQRLEFRSGDRVKVCSTLSAGVGLPFLFDGLYENGLAVLISFFPRPPATRDTTPPRPPRRLHPGSSVRGFWKVRNGRRGQNIGSVTVAEGRVQAVGLRAAGSLYNLFTEGFNNLPT